MGMYDSIYIDKNKLPLSKEDKDLIPDNNEWQTKSLNCMLDRYYVQHDNNVLMSSLNWEGELEEVKQSEIHGFVRFYSSINGQWIEFIGKFTDGKLVKINRI